MPPAAVVAKPVGGTRTTLGKQVSSRRVSAPSFGFGSATRENQEKVFVSQEHAALTGKPCSPGPVYMMRAAVGPQVDGAIASAPQWSFSNDERFEKLSKYATEIPAPGHHDVQSGIGDQTLSSKASLPHYGFGTATRDQVQKVYITSDHNKALFGRGSPGPSTYMLNPAMGKQRLSSGPSGYSRSSKNQSQPSWVMGKAERFEPDRAIQMPGPCAYTITPAVGVQVSSKKPSLPRFGFGSGTRDDAAKVYISAEHEKVSSGGKDVPGPGAYPIKAMTGNRNASSKQPTGSAWGFGTSKRFGDPVLRANADNPGPGQYVI